MNSPRDLRRRIRSISSTAQITKAMQMVAASKMRKAQLAALAGRPFVHVLYRIQREATNSHGRFQPSVAGSSGKSKNAPSSWSAADKGLCGALNSNVFRAGLGIRYRNPRFSSPPDVRLRNSSHAPAGSLSPSSHTGTRLESPRLERLQPSPAISF